MKVVGRGNTAEVYEWKDDRVLKLFKEGYPKAAVEKEFHNAMAIRDLDFPKPMVYEIVSFENRMGIVYDMVDGESLLDWVLKTSNIQTCAKYMAELHKQIHKNRVSNVPGYKSFLKYCIDKAPTSSLDKEEILIKLSSLPDGDTLCHGDFHPGNIFLSEGNTTVIDFMNVCQGNYLYDVARTVFLVEYTPVPEQADNREMILQFKKSLADLYLIHMDITRDMIQDYLAVIIAARSGEL